MMELFSLHFKLELTIQNDDQTVKMNDTEQVIGEL